MPRPTWEATITVDVDSDDPTVAWVQLRANKWGWSLLDDGYCYAEEAPLEEVPELVNQAIQDISKDISPFEHRSTELRFD